MTPEYDSRTGKLRLLVPDRRLVYELNGTVRIEVDVTGDGHFVAASSAAAAPPK